MPPILPIAASSVPPRQKKTHASLTRFHSLTVVHHSLPHVCQCPHIYKTQKPVQPQLPLLGMQEQRTACIWRKEASTMISYCILPAASKTDEIMSRYRPIAPKPQLPPRPLLDGPPATESPFLARALSSLQKTRSTRARKRAKTCHSTATPKRPKIHILQPSSLASCLAKHTQLPFFEHGLPCFPYPPSPRLPDSPPAGGDLANISLLPYAPSSDGLPAEGFHLLPTVIEERAMNLNAKAEAMEVNNLLQELPAPMGSPAVIVPQPVRPVGSSISVGCISETLSSASSAPVSKKPEEVEEEVESEALPSVVSDSNNKVRLANSAYKAMVGQPECPWLDSMVAKDGSRVGSATSKRISGEVMLDLSHTSVPMPANRFSCRVKIEWASNGMKTFVDAPCDVTRLFCESKDYLFTWRFLITDMRP